MKIGVVGTGYVGAVQGAGLAHLGHEVISIDIDQKKIDLLNQGIPPIHEDGLQELIRSGLDAKRLVYTTDFEELAAREVEVIFLCLPTPPNEDGTADLSYVLTAAKSIAEVMTTETVLVNKSTVPAGSAQKVLEHVAPLARDGIRFHVASNPEFLREGTAVSDFLNPNTIVLGTDTDHAKSVLRKVYASFDRDGIVFETDPVTSELIKYARNGFRAHKISFVNSMAEIAHALGANIDELLAAMRQDPVIGDHFTEPGPGWGGSCFPKDSRALLAFAKAAGVPFHALENTMTDNVRHKTRLARQVIEHFGDDIEGRSFAVWGAAFKANTDDMRESPSIDTINLLLEAGAKIVLHDPQALDNAKLVFAGNDRVTFSDDAHAATKDTDGLIIITEWPQFSTPDVKKLANNMQVRVIFDGRNLFNPNDTDPEGTVADLKEHGFIYKSFGRKPLGL